METKKYKLTNRTKKVNGHTLYRIKALKDVCDAKKGDLGGYIESEENLSQDGVAWIYDKACVYGNAKVYEGAEVRHHAQIYDNAEVFGSAIIRDNAKVFGNAKIYDNAYSDDNAEVYGDAMIYAEASVFHHAVIKDKAEIFGQAEVGGHTIVCGVAKIYGHDVILRNGLFDGISNLSDIESKNLIQQGWESELETAEMDTLDYISKHSEIIQTK